MARGETRDQLIGLQIDRLCCARSPPIPSVQAGLGFAVVDWAELRCLLGSRSLEVAGLNWADFWRDKAPKRTKMSLRTGCVQGSGTARDVLLHQW